MHGAAYPVIRCWVLPEGREVSRICLRNRGVELQELRGPFEAGVFFDGTPNGDQRVSALFLASVIELRVSPQQASCIAHGFTRTGRGRELVVRWWEASSRKPPSFSKPRF